MENLKSALIEHYGFDNDFSIERIHAGFLSENYKFVSGGKVYFLKGYRKGIERNRDIHKAKKYFRDHGIPVILPIETKIKDTLFTLGDKVYALFPFVEGIHHNRQHISDEVAIEIAKLLAKMHKIAMDFPMTVPAVIKFWNDVDAFLKIDTIIDLLSKISKKSTFDVFVEETLKLKKKLITRDSAPVSKYDIEPHILIHGDFHEQNLFFDNQGKIKYVFDFGEVKMGPRAQELWRSAEFMFINGKFTDENIAKVILYFRTYNSCNSITREVLEAGFNIHYQMLIHSTWVETEHYVLGNYKVDHFLEKGTLAYFGDNKDQFLKRVMDGVYGK